MGLMKQFFCNEMAARNADLLNYPTACMLYATHLVSMLHPEPAWIHLSRVLKYRSSTYAIIFLCQIYEAVGFNIPNTGSRGLEVYFCFLWPCHTLVFSPGELPI